MNIGVGLPNTLAGADRALVLEWARRAEAGPFTSLAVFDRLRYYSLDPLTTLAAVAGVTDEIRLATLIVAGPLRNDAMLAKQAATLDVLSGGRLTLGLALGARRDDYALAGVPYGGRGDRLTAQLGTLRDLWAGDELGPTPVQDGGPQILIGGLSDRAFGRVARFGDGYVHGGGPPHIFGRFAEKARAAWAEHGRPGAPQLWGMGYYALGDDKAVEAGRQYLLDYYAFTGPFAERIAEGLLTTPQAVLQFARGYDDEGCDELVLFPTVPGAAQLDRLVDILA